MNFSPEIKLNWEKHRELKVEQECVTPVDVLAGCNISWHRLAEAANLTLAPVYWISVSHSMFIYTICTMYTFVWFGRKSRAKASHSAVAPGLAGFVVELGI